MSDAEVIHNYIYSRLDYLFDLFVLLILSHNIHAKCNSKDFDKLSLRN